MFRLALNVSATRLILLQGAAFDGKIIRAFGEFVVGGNYVVGFIIFIILVAVQFIVITKGATRTAEVAARFTLDAMPGKQMSIDSDLSTGLITEDEAKRRRRRSGRRPTSTAPWTAPPSSCRAMSRSRIVIMIINIIGGFIIGMVMRSEPFDLALKTYTLLTIGEGLVAQIPSLLITTATGIIVTRAVSDDNIGDDLANQLGSAAAGPAHHRRDPGLGASSPVSPRFRVLILSVGLGSLGYVLFQSRERRRKRRSRKRSRRP